MVHFRSKVDLTLIPASSLKIYLDMLLLDVQLYRSIYGAATIKFRASPIAFSRIATVIKERSADNSILFIGEYPCVKDSSLLSECDLEYTLESP